MSETYCGLLNVLILALLAGSHGLIQHRLAKANEVLRKSSDDES